MAQSNTAKLEAEWKAAKTEMCEWIKKSMPLLPPADKASDVKAIVDAMKQGETIVFTAMPTGSDNADNPERDVGKASDVLRRAVKRMDGKMSTIGGADIFGEEEDEDEDD